MKRTSSQQRKLFLICTFCQSKKLFLFLNLLERRTAKRLTFRVTYKNLKLQSNFIKITLRHGCPTVNLLHIFRTSFPRASLEGCFCSVLSCDFQPEFLDNLECKKRKKYYFYKEIIRIRKTLKTLWKIVI